MPARWPLILGYDTLRDPVDMASVLHLAAGFGAEVHLIGQSLPHDHPKVLRKLRSWRPDLAENPGAAPVQRFADCASWIREVRARGFAVAATLVRGGTPPWTGMAPAGLAVLFGEETHGIALSTHCLCDHRWSFPLGSHGGFYTIAQATALLLGGRW